MVQRDLDLLVLAVAVFLFLPERQAGSAPRPLARRPACVLSFPRSGVDGGALHRAGEGGDSWNSRLGARGVARRPPGPVELRRHLCLSGVSLHARFNAPGTTEDQVVSVWLWAARRDSPRLLSH